MDVIGIIVEYNPFHNGHKYHINKIKEMFPNSLIVAVMNGHFSQRGDVSILNKWDKTNIALDNNIDLVIELPFPFATQAADIFSKGAIALLDAIKVDYLIFGSEINDINILTKCARIQLESDEYQEAVKDYLDYGINYPMSLAKALKDFTNINIDKPNDILGLCYIKELLKINSKIKPLTIKRINDYHDLSLNKNITSASSIRNAIKNNIDIKKYIPKISYQYLKDNTFFIEDYFMFLKYKIMSEINNLNIYQTVDEGLEARIKKEIIRSVSLEDLIQNIKTKRYTYNKIKRMFTHILVNFTKKEANKYQNIEYIRILGFNDLGRNYLNSIRKKVDLPIITTYQPKISEMLKLEFRTTCIYASILNEDDKKLLIEKEYKNKPIYKKANN